ncbi:MAG: asparagine synthase (glutamine-hydrolyzing) [Kiritimatiellia bacterium]
MCGICGFNWNDPALAARMAAVIRHRGPDDDGFYHDAGVSLAFRRLSIIDLSRHGHQPMANETGTVQLVFNGEIYNFRELRRELEAAGHVFAGQTDSEVIVHGYETWGVEVVRHLRGMFAFAVWDAPRQRLLVARDRIGIKPLYYHWANGRFRFASEIKAILEDSSVPRELNPQALYDYIGFEFTPAPDTLFQNIQKLPAGHRILLEKGGLKVESWWDLSYKPAANITFDGAVEQLRGLLDSCTESHLVSDVPLGVFLSGGLDSSALVAMMRRHIPGRLRTFTIGYADKSFSELEYAKIVADQFGTDHQVLMVDDLKPAYVERALWHLDEPMTDLSCVPLMLVCEQARKAVTVCLSGEGGDEIFAGYDRFKASRLNRYFSRALPRPLRRLFIDALVAGLPDRPQKKGAINMLKRFLQGARLPDSGGHLRWQFFGGAEQDKRLFQPEFLGRINPSPFRLLAEYAARCDAADPVNRELYMDTRFMMPDSVLMKVDKMSMASSLEIRVPLLDHVLVEFLASLPGEWKLKGFRTKHLFRAALKGILPERIIERGKQGYSLPVKNLLRTDFKDWMITLLHESPELKRHVREAAIDRLIAEHLSMKHNHNHVLWALMNVAIWDAKFLRH